MTKLKTVNIKGKEYVEVNERLKHFRANYKGWSLTSDIVELTDDRCVVKATIFDDIENIRATGHAYEKEGSKAKPKLDEDKFNNMLKAIDAGKGDAVKAKMPNYDIEDYQLKVLNQKLNG